MPAPSPLVAYLSASPITYMSNPAYDNKGRQLPFEETPTHSQERAAFVQSIRLQRRVSTWVQDQQAASSSTSLDALRHAPSTPSTSAPGASPSPPSSSSSPKTSSTISCDSSPPRTPSSPSNTLHAHTQQQTLDIELNKSFEKLVITPAPFPQHNRNYKNLHLPQTLIRSLTRSQPRARPQAQTPPRGIFDSNSYTSPPSYFLYSYPHAPPEEEDATSASPEPYIFYSSSVSSIGEFPTPKTSVPLSSSSSLPRPLTFSTLHHSKPPSGTGVSLNARQVGDH